MCYYTSMNYKRLLKVFKNKDKVAVVGHKNPDMDAIGSVLVFRDILKEVYGVKTVDVFFDYDRLTDEASESLLGVNVNPPVQDYDIVVRLDSASDAILGTNCDLYKNAKYKVVIDHHDTDDMSGDVNIIEICSSTCEIIYRISKELKYPLSNRQLSLIYSGMVTDTRNFIVGRMNKLTFDIVGEISERINISEISRKFVNTTSWITNQLTAIAINNAELINENCIISFITREEANSLNADQSSFIGIVNHLANTKGVVFTALILPEENYFKISMRRDGIDFNVGEFAKKYGGGGHAGASGFTHNGTIEDIKNIIKEELFKYL
ncbi:MAG: hypothetical protein E7374_01370 [Clostridiales bacterium]|nr:hypothetical protein [Clostridiales bacterium]